MSFDDRELEEEEEEEEKKKKQWGCVKVQMVTSIVRDIGDQPCLHQSPIKITKMLKPEKWQATFDSEGKLHRFQKALRLIYLGGVDPSIRAEVWEFLLGCYTPGSTSEYRRQLRTARREKFKDLIKQCQTMHSSVGTGSLAYVVGSKVMDMRTLSNDNRTEVAVQSRQDTSSACSRPSAGDSADLVSVRGSTDSAAYDSSCHIPSYGPYSCSSPKPESNAHESQYAMKTFFDFPALPVTNLFERSGEDNTDYEANDKRSSQHKLTYEEEIMHNFQINNNVELVTESNGSASSNKTEIINRLRISDVRETATANTSQVRDVTEDRVSEWLWTLHRIAVDVVRTDCHLEFFEDTKNLARMSDILAVYAWVDPATGYCQGMSDLLSPFVVLFEDTADAFWCFEMLLRRMRDNFLVEGPTGVMKQLQALWHILEFTDREMFAHFSHIGAESLHFAFRMLLVLFRRELSFDEALCMWEMMWAADFDEAVAYELVENCLEPLVVQIPRNSSGELGRHTNENDNGSSNCDPQIKDENVERTNTDNNTEKRSNRPFCGLARDFWSRNDTMHICTVVSSTRNGDDELPVFCVAAILIMNRQKIIRETHSIDDLIKIFNDNVLKINIKRCVRTAIKLRKKYFYKLIKSKNPAGRNSDG